MYYQVFRSEGAISCKQSFDDDDKTIGRTRLQLITPPRSAEHILKHIATIEGMPEITSADLFPDSDYEGVDDTFRITLKDMDGPGSTPEFPIALVLKETIPQTIPEETIPPPSPAPIVEVPEAPVLAVDHTADPWSTKEPIALNFSFAGWRKARWVGAGDGKDHHPQPYLNQKLSHLWRF